MHSSVVSEITARLCDAEGRVSESVPVWIGRVSVLSDAVTFRYSSGEALVACWPGEAIQPTYITCLDNQDRVWFVRMIWDSQNRDWSVWTKLAGADDFTLYAHADRYCAYSREPYQRALEVVTIRARDAAPSVRHEVWSGMVTIEWVGTVFATLYVAKSLDPQVDAQLCLKYRTNGAPLLVTPVPPHAAQMWWKAYHTQEGALIAAAFQRIAAGLLPYTGLTEAKATGLITEFV